MRTGGAFFGPNQSALDANAFREEISNLRDEVSNLRDEVSARSAKLEIQVQNSVKAAQYYSRAGFHESLLLLSDKKAPEVDLDFLRKMVADAKHISGFGYKSTPEADLKLLCECYTDLMDFCLSMLPQDE